MSYINIEERKKKRKRFAFLYSITVILIIAACTAFYVPPQLAPEKVIMMKTDVPQLAPKSITTDTTQQQARMVQSQLLAKDQQIQQLQEELIIARKNKESSAATNTPKPTDDTKFLRWALSSQTAAVAKLKNENTRLKAQVNDLKKYLQ